MEIGYIIYKNKEKGFGFIKNQSGETHFFVSNILGTSNIGQEVQYITTSSSKGLTALGTTLSCTYGCGHKYDCPPIDGWYNRQVVSDYHTIIYNENGEALFCELREKGFQRSDEPSGENIWLNSQINNLSEGDIVVFKGNNYRVKCPNWTSWSKLNWIDTTFTAEEETANEEAAARAAAEREAAREAERAAKRAAHKAAYAAKTAELLEVIKVTPIENIYITLIQCDGGGYPESDVTIKALKYLAGRYNWPDWNCSVYKGQPEGTEEFNSEELSSECIVLEYDDYNENYNYDILKIIEKLKEMYPEYAPATEETSSTAIKEETTEETVEEETVEVSSETKDFLVYYTKKVTNKKGKPFLAKRNCIFLNSNFSAIFDCAKKANWEIEGLPEQIINGKQYAIDNGIAYTENDGENWIFDHC